MAITPDNNFTKIIQKPKGLLIFFVYEKRNFHYKKDQSVWTNNCKHKIISLNPFLY